jgi:hypothetical protein
MPRVMAVGPHRFFIYSNEGDEPPHVHVRRERMLAKLWLDPVRVARSRGFGDRELRRITKLVVENRTLFLEAWDELFTP